MDVIVMNTSFEDIAVIDSYESLIWTRRYCGYGDFELYLPVNDELISLLRQNYYLRLRESDCVMIIENIEVKLDIEEGDHLTVSGRSLESLLERRIVWNQTVLKGNPQTEIKKLVEANIGVNATEVRKISNFKVNLSTDTNITGITGFSAQFTGDNLYDAIVAICAVYNLGFKVTLSDDNEFVFQLYYGLDRTYEQSDNPRVIFSPEYDTLIGSDYQVSSQSLKTVALIAGEGEGVNRRRSVVDLLEETGINRRELYVDARDISSSTDDGTLTDAEYTSLLDERGMEKLLENLPFSAYNADPIIGYQYVLDEDYSIGDLVELEDSYGMSSICRITEITISEDSDGYKVYPTFSAIDS